MTPNGQYDVLDVIHEKQAARYAATINDVRALEDEPPFPGKEYDEPGIPGGASVPPAEDDDTAPVTEGDAA